MRLMENTQTDPYFIMTSSDFDSQKGPCFFVILKFRENGERSFETGSFRSDWELNLET